MAISEKLCPTLVVVLTLKLFDQVLAQRQPALHKILDHADEAFAILMLALEYHSLRTQGEASRCLISFEKTDLLMVVRSC